MAILGRNSFIIAAATLFIFFMIDPVLLYQQQQQPYFAYAEQRSCIDYNRTENTITIKCDTSSFRDVVDTINDDQAVLSNLGDGQYLLNANLQVDDGATFSMSQDEDGINWLKIAGANGIIVDGKIEIDGVKITSWDTVNNSGLWEEGI